MNEEISSVQNPKIKDAIKLRQRSSRDATGLFLIEGYRELFRASGAKVAIQTLFFCPELFLGGNETALISEISQQGARVFPCSERVFRKLSYRDRPDGLLGVAVQNPLSLADIAGTLKSHRSFFVVAEAIEKPGNLGTILRSSDAVGVDAVIVCDRCTDIYNPNVVRASVGTLFTRPVIEAEGEAILKFLKDASISIVAATPSADKCYTEVDLSGPIAIAVGTEQLGLSPFWMDQADIQVRIPMHGVADSLNVAMATTLCLYEVLRQRGRLNNP